MTLFSLKTFDKFIPFSIFSQGVTFDELTGGTFNELTGDTFDGFFHPYRR